MIDVDFNEALGSISRRMDKAAGSVRKASVFAVNEAARFGRAAAIREMDNQITLGRKYMSDNMLVSKARLTAGEVSASITGKQRPVSLSRFLVNKSLRNTFTSLKKGEKSPLLKTRVRKGGAAKNMPKAFLIRMRSGRELSETKYNIGMAIRLPNGQSVSGRHKGLRPYAKGKNSSLYLLHGPSVDQLFRSIVDTAGLDDTIAERAQGEFLRQIARLEGV